MTDVNFSPQGEHQHSPEESSRAKQVAGPPRHLVSAGRRDDHAAAVGSCPTGRNHSAAVGWDRGPAAPPERAGSSQPQLDPVLSPAETEFEIIREMARHAKFRTKLFFFPNESWLTQGAAVFWLSHCFVIFYVKPGVDLFKSNGSKYC